MERMNYAERIREEEVITVAPEDVQTHLRRGKMYFNLGLYTDALKEFEAILKIAPGNIETRVWIRKVKEQLTKPEIKAVAKEVTRRECLWMNLGLVSYRLCTNDYDCFACEFDQDVQRRIAANDPEVEEILRKQLELPGPQRLCRYALKGEISYRICTRLFQCATCEFSQMLEYAIEQKLTAREEAMHIKKQNKWLSYWGVAPQSETGRKQ